MPIDKDDFKTIRNRRYFKAHCHLCGADRGYKIPSEANRPCVRCNCIKAAHLSHKNKNKKVCNENKCVAWVYKADKCKTHYSLLSDSERTKLFISKPRKCRQCNKTFIPKKVTLFCSDQCKIEKQRAYRKLYNSKNKKKIKNDLARWRANNPDKVSAYRERLDVKIKANLRSRLSRAVKKDLKGGSAVNDLGCTIDELKRYLESKFQEGMSWDNYSRNGWHIDHIKPLDLFDLTNPEEVKVACHYTNLQPLWAKDNLEKSNHYDLD